MFYLTLPAVFLKFWYIEAPIGILKFFLSFNKSLLSLISLPLLIKTFFKPWKSEYRKGLVNFSIIIGVFIKTFVIFADIVIFIFVLLIEILFFILFIFWPIFTVILILKL